MKTRLLLSATLFLWAQASGSSIQQAASDPEAEADSIFEETEEDLTNFEERLNPPELNPQEDITPFTASADNVPRFVNVKANRIKMNGDDWSMLYKDLIGSSHFGEPFKILHIGDSHIQADAATATTRGLLQDRFGNAGRGLITPLKMAKTNEPRDYRFTSSTPWITSKLMKTPWDSPMQFTGVSITPMRREFDLELGTVSSDIVRENPFSEIRLFYQGNLSVDNCVSDGNKIFFTCEYGQGVATIRFHNQVDNVKLEMSTDGDPYDVHIAGAELLNGNNGVVYDTIGNNGAMYLSYNALSDFHRISSLKPSLVIIALGANEAFGVISDSTFERTIDIMVNRVKEANPQAKILLVTPIECQKRTSGSRKRRRRSAGGFAINSNVLRLRNVINRYSEEHHIPVYDFYEVAGGAGASSKWAMSGLMNQRDRIHLTWPGYELQGKLTYDALMRAFTANKAVN